ncbi:hypothetical protein DK28_0201510 [Peptococcaceae bacterium SCADC1_2_3]|jgi:ABC-type taurine transport system substrate-binding protein|nr:hypothetical protein DK28_0201510 [Peptococcaceae bacterium SCADC1_2_3]KFI34714.1 hypothetical protein HY00_10350 [Peptococcaceae bacterium SCADC1_2_3]HBQ27845.1 copper amine oxidase N-terminal domain-containing protein [Desulfotomaculum sp.]HCJ78555.1 copper amine oxidase N-terminal domain-containing protein [Desulfotomaculum sp.]
MVKKKKYNSTALMTAFILMATLLVTQAAFLLPAQAQQIKVVVNGKTLKEVKAVMINGRVLVPSRAVAEALNAKVNWNNQTKTATVKRDKTSLEVTINRQVAYLNDKPITLDVSAKLINNKLYLPLRLVSESLQAKVKWEAKDCMVTIIDNYCPWCIPLS